MELFFLRWIFHHFLALYLLLGPVLGGIFGFRILGGSNTPFCLRPLCDGLSLFCLDTKARMSVFYGREI